MQITLMHDHYDAAHLDAVIDEMRDLGAPTIKAIWVEAHGAWMALEGCHRIRAAKALGLEPVIDEIECDIDAKLSDYGVDAQDDATIEALLDDMHRRAMVVF